MQLLETMKNNGVIDFAQYNIIKSIEQKIMESENDVMQRRLLSCLDSALSIAFNNAEMRGDTFYLTCKKIAEKKQYTSIKYLLNFMEYHHFHQRGF